MKLSLNILLLLFTIHYSSFTNAQDAASLVNKVKAKLDKVNDYKATGVLKTDVSFIKAPVSDIVIYFKKPNRFRLVKNIQGINYYPMGSDPKTLLINDFRCKSFRNSF